MSSDAGYSGGHQSEVSTASWKPVRKSASNPERSPSRGGNASTLASQQILDEINAKERMKRVEETLEQARVQAYVYPHTPDKLSSVAERDSSEERAGYQTPTEYQLLGDEQPLPVLQAKVATADAATNTTSEKQLRPTLPAAAATADAATNTVPTAVVEYQGLLNALGQVPRSLTVSVTIRTALDLLTDLAPGHCMPAFIPDIQRRFIWSTAPLQQTDLRRAEDPIRHGFSDIWLEPVQPYPGPPCPLVRHSGPPAGNAVPTLYVSPGLRIASEELAYIMVVQGALGAQRQKVVLRDTQMAMATEIMAALANGWSVVFSAAVLRKYLWRMIDPRFAFVLIGEGALDFLQGMDPAIPAMGFLC